MMTMRDMLPTSSAPPRPLQHMLIVDSDPIVALVTQRGLQLALGSDVEVTVAPSAGVAWLRCIREHIDLVIVDPSPPDRAAGALVKALRELCSDVVVLVLTAGDTPRLRVEMRALGVQHYFAKPLTLLELGHGVRAALGMDAAPRDGVSDRSIP
ncbi:MAG TPA: response regulator [Roseiflexaceae bacterium]|nr:response regulator [Roseiflexaceae bacterium]